MDTVCPLYAVVGSQTILYDCFPSATSCWPLVGEVMASKFAVCAKAEPMRARKAAGMVNCILSDMFLDL